MLYKFLMDNLPKFEIPLRELSKDISSKLSNGTKKILIMSPDHEKANRLLQELNDEEKSRCEVRIYTPKEYFSHTQEYLLRKKEKGSHKKKIKRYSIQPGEILLNRRPYEIDLYQLELT